MLRYVAGRVRDALIESVRAFGVGMKESRHHCVTMLLTKLKVFRLDLSKADLDKVLVNSPLLLLMLIFIVRSCER